MLFILDRSLLLFLVHWMLVVLLYCPVNLCIPDSQSTGLRKLLITAKNSSLVVKEDLGVKLPLQLDFKTQFATYWLGNLGQPSFLLNALISSSVKCVNKLTMFTCGMRITYVDSVELPEQNKCSGKVVNCY